LGAVAAGVAIGLLLAPEKGAKMRGRIQRKASSLANSLSSLFTNAKGELQELKGRAKQHKSVAEQKVNRLKENFI
jgi:gas vesicle protein